ncbi:Hypothetical predicted protein [Podarcis lilfordi]|uniref:Uncharacterized protein n=1 Tax=Podarcis lilfordi TaxID=74358 RepID=A0AA35PPB4_9SAUR|nr:Hypothetical predicted protein [Podarcis lilfordi]
MPLSSRIIGRGMNHSTPSSKSSNTRPVKHSCDSFQASMFLPQFSHSMKWRQTPPQFNAYLQGNPLSCAG